FDVIDTNHMGGWAWLAGTDTPQKLDVYDGSTLLTTITADKFRQDLLNAGIGNGVHGFDSPTPASLIDGQSHYVSIKFAGTSTDLSGSPRQISGPFYGQGSLDVADCSGIAGWAWDASQPTGRITVAFYADGQSTPFYVATANGFRGDLLGAGIGDG